METVNFGEHVMVDGYGGDAQRLHDKDFVLRCLNELPSLLGMRKLAEPAVHHAAGSTPKDTGGWSGFVVIEESHISIHTFPGKRFVSADVYTCKNGIDAAYVETYFREAFSLQDVETHFIRRGTRFPLHDIV